MTVQRDTGRPWPNDWDGVGTSRSRAGMPPVLRPRRLGSVPVRSHVAIEPPTGGTNRPRFGPAPTGGDTRPDFITLRDQSSVRWTRRIRLVCGDLAASGTAMCDRIDLCGHARGREGGPTPDVAERGGGQVPRPEVSAEQQARGQGNSPGPPETACPAAAGPGRRKLPAARLLPEGCGRAWLGGVEGQAGPPRYSAWCAGLRTLRRSAWLRKR
jgi:hypothetical protein